MVIDTSALVAIFQGQAETQTFIEAIEFADTVSMSAASFVEVSIVIECRFGADGVRDLDLFLNKAGIALVACDERQAQIARRGWRKYGKGRHRAALNFGDCFAYALAVSLGQPLLYKGNDFAHTDLASALA